jgi:hypothetical protein
MHWEVLIIPLIALAVWIIGTLSKSEEDKTKKTIGRRPTASGRAPGRRVVTDLDRFLEEARRRREPEERRKAPPPPSRTPPARPPLRERPTRPEETPRVATTVVVKEEPAVVLPAPRPFVQPPLAEPAPTLASPKLEERRVGTPQSRQAPLEPAPVARPPSIAQQVRSLLSKPQTAATAYVLREIFDRPLCKRRP